ncbi:MAG TPA: hypothetical protein P5048_01325 [Chlamydiales bacterium]|nr:hypothetical protein [Chlamydiales bacterium]
MSIEKRIKESIKYINEDDYEGSILPLSAAIDATAKNEYPAIKGNKKRITKFLREKQGFITKYLLMGAELTGNITLANGKSLEEHIYEHLRCSIVHEAKLNADTLSLEEAPILGCSKKNLKLANRHIEGLILAVIISETNQKRSLPNNLKCSFLPNVSINNFLGKETELRKALF